VFVKRRDITVSPFAMQTAFPSSDYYELIRLPRDHRSLRCLLSFSTHFLRESSRISQVPAKTLYTCHGLITPPGRYNLATHEKKIFFSFERLLCMDFDGVTNLIT